VLIEPGGGEVIGDSPERRVEILADHPALAATVSRYAPGREGASLHVHRRHTDLFFVLEGELTVRLGVEDRQATVPAGALARVPAGIVHGFRNASDEDVRYLNLHAPGERFADYLRGLRDGRPFPFDQFDPPADGGRPLSEATIGPPELKDEGLTIGLCDGVDEQPHVHPDQLEALYVLEGEAVLSEELRAPAGAWAHIPAGVEHALTFPTPTRYLRALVRSA
jgi:quercetin dioxygenase-like cupin family protein